MSKHTVYIAVAVSLLVAGNGLAQNAATPSGFGSKWADAAKMPNFFTGMWRSDSPMVDTAVEVKYTKQAKEYIANYKPVKDLAVAGVGCKTPGLPIIQRAGTPLKFQFSPGLLSIYLESASMVRFIHLNAKHRNLSNPTFLGESIGHFEGDTLVVDTVDFRDDIIFQYGTLGSKTKNAGPADFAPQSSFIANAVFGPHGPNLRMVERMRLRDPDTLEVKMTVYDDTVFTTTYEAPVQLFRRLKGGDEVWPAEWQCEVSQVAAYDPATDDTVSLSPEEALKKYEEGTLR